MSDTTSSMLFNEEPSEVEIETGAIINDTARNDDTLYRVVYVDHDRVLMRSNRHLKRTGQRHYRCDFRNHFDEYVFEGRYGIIESHPDAPPMPVEINATEIEWSDVPGVGDKTERNLWDMGVKTDHDLETVPDEDILGIYGMSERKLEKMREFVND